MVVAVVTGATAVSQPALAAEAIRNLERTRAFVVKSEGTLVTSRWLRNPVADWRTNQVPNQRIGLCQSLRDTAAIRAVGNVEFCRNFLMRQGNQSVPTNGLF